MPAAAQESAATATAAAATTQPAAAVPISVAKAVLGKARTRQGKVARVVKIHTWS